MKDRHSEKSLSNLKFKSHKSQGATQLSVFLIYYHGQHANYIQSLGSNTLLASSTLQDSWWDYDEITFRSSETDLTWRYITNQSCVGLHKVFIHPKGNYFWIMTENHPWVYRDQIQLIISWSSA